MARYVPQNAPYKRSSEYVAVPGYMGSYGEITADQKKYLTYGAVALGALFIWKKMKK